MLSLGIKFYAVCNAMGYPATIRLPEAQNLNDAIVILTADYRFAKLNHNQRDAQEDLCISPCVTSEDAFDETMLALGYSPEKQVISANSQRDEWWIWKRVLK